MKKKISIMAALLLVISCLAGCGSKLTAKEVMAKATEKQKEIASMDSSGKMKIDMDMGGSTISVNADMDIKQSAINSDDMKLAMKMNMDMLGQSMEMNAYYVDGYYYLDSMGEKAKMPMDVKEVVEQAKQGGAFTEIPEDAYKEIEMKEEGGNYVISFTADGSKLSEMIDSMMGSMMEGLASGDMELGDVTGTLTVNKDYYVVNEKMVMDMTLDVEGTKMKASVELDMDINNPGEEVTVELPTDLDSYQEQ